MGEGTTVPSQENKRKRERKNKKMKSFQIVEWKCDGQ
jgi:hypothetical protein